MTTINISKDIEAFIKAKTEIEQYLIDAGTIAEKMEIPAFVTYLNMGNTIYMNNNKIIPFSHIKLGDNEYLFYTAENSADVLMCQSALGELNYDLSSLKKFDVLTIISDPSQLEKMELFIINNAYYVR